MALTLRKNLPSQPLKMEKDKKIRVRLKIEALFVDTGAVSDQIKKEVRTNRHPRAIDCVEWIAMDYQSLVPIIDISSCSVVVTSFVNLVGRDGSILDREIHVYVPFVDRTLESHPSIDVGGVNNSKKKSMKHDDRHLRRHH